MVGIEHLLSSTYRYSIISCSANLSDESETNYDSCAIAKRRLINTLSVSANSCIDIFPEDKINAAAQTVNQRSVFPSQCFYCAQIINSEADIENHRLSCHERFLSLKCKDCSKEFSDLCDLKSHKEKDHLSTSLQRP